MQADLDRMADDGGRVPDDAWPDPFDVTDAFVIVGDSCPACGSVTVADYEGDPSTPGLARELARCPGGCGVF